MISQKTKRELSTLSSIFFLTLLFLLAFFIPWISPYGFDEQNLLRSYQGPSWEHWFGCDALGRDLATRLLYGARVSLSIAFFTALSSLLIGATYGLIAGLAGGWIDRVMMRFIDILYTLPSLMVMILMMMIFGRGLLGIFLSLTLTGWLGAALLMRAQVLSLKKRPFVEAAEALGASPMRIAWRHLLPNALGPLMVELSFQIPSNILSEAFLSFLGIGLRPPTPSWGILAEEGWRALQSYPHLSLFTGLLIFLCMRSFNTLGDRLRDHLDPQLKRSLSS